MRRDFIYWQQPATNFRHRLDRWGHFCVPTWREGITHILYYIRPYICSDRDKTADDLGLIAISCESELPAARRLDYALSAGAVIGTVAFFLTARHESGRSRARCPEPDLARPASTGSLSTR